MGHLRRSRGRPNMWRVAINRNTELKKMMARVDSTVPWQMALAFWVGFQDETAPKRGHFESGRVELPGVVWCVAARMACRPRHGSRGWSLAV